MQHSLYGGRLKLNDFKSLHGRPVRLAHRRIARTAAAEGKGGGSSDPLASEFASLVNRLDLQKGLQQQRPSHLMPPTAVVAAQMEALQRPDWPDSGAGLRTAFLFAMPRGCGGASAPRSDPRKQRASSGGGGGSGEAGRSEAAAAQPSFPTAAVPESTPRRAWGAKEEWLSLEDFGALLRSPPYDIILGCDAWRPVSDLVFPGSRQGTRAVQAVEVTAAQRQRAPASGSSAFSSSGSAGGEEGRPYRFTFCLERVEEGGMQGCWLTVGVKVGDYSL